MNIVAISFMANMEAVVRMKTFKIDNSWMLFDHTPIHLTITTSGKCHGRVSRFRMGMTLLRLVRTHYDLQATWRMDQGVVSKDSCNRWRANEVRAVKLM